MNATISSAVSNLMRKLNNSFIGYAEVNLTCRMCHKVFKRYAAEVHGFNEELFKPVRYSYEVSDPVKYKYFKYMSRGYCDACHASHAYKKLSGTCVQEAKWHMNSAYRVMQMGWSVGRQLFFSLRYYDLCAHSTIKTSCFLNFLVSLQ